MTTPFCASTSTNISATQLLLESLTNYVLSNCIHFDSVIYLSQHIAFNGVIFTYQYHLRDIIIHRVTTKYQNKVDMKGLIVLKLMGCHNNSNYNYLLYPTVQVPCPWVVCSGDTVTWSYHAMHTYQNHTTCSISQACSFKSFVDISVLQHALINANLCCFPRYKFHIHKL